ncbi:protoglobin domain-containing protein [Planctomycetota bacterium]|nr:protoglobin domain-containing protein [Planctomycetota bacterium]
MQLAPKARFDALATFMTFEPADVDAIRGSINFLLREISELVRMVDEAMKSEAAEAVLGELSGTQKEKLQSLFASFIMRTINCNYDEDFCDYAVEVSQGEDVPDGVFSLGLGLAMNYVARTLPASVDDSDQLKDMLTAWNKLTCVLRELTRKA